MATATNSVWMATSPETNFDAMSGHVNVDVAIVGGGISGLTAAVLLKRAGKTVAVVEKSRIATGETGYTTAHLTEVIDTRYKDLIADFGQRGAELVAESSRAAIEQIASFVSEGNISCDFHRVPGFLYTEDTDEFMMLEDELSAMKKVGLVASMAGDLPFEFHSRAAIRVEDQAQFHPRAYLLALAREIPGGGSYIFENCRVTEMNDGEPCEVVTDHGFINARDVLVLTNSPICNWLFIHTKIPAYRTYALGVRTRSPLKLDGLFWDTANPYHYTRTHEFPGEGELLIVGGEDHKTGTNESTDGCFDRLERYARSRFDITSIPYRWSGQIQEPVDGLPYIGRNSFSKHIFIGTGYSGNGMTFGTMAGMLLTDLVLGLGNPWAELYDATRIHPLASAAEFVSENVDFPKYFFGDRLKNADVESIDAVQNGEGRIVEINGDKVAVYRDDKGEVHAVAPECTHMGCHVHWNAAEKTWDCPCHGSRFDPEGKVANGPAIQDLKKVDIHAHKPE